MNVKNNNKKQTNQPIDLFVDRLVRFSTLILCKQGIPILLIENHGWDAQNVMIYS